MDFLKYLDVIIGMSVVMVLLSPLVTAITHVVLWWANSRSTFLEQALHRLIVHLEGHPATLVSVRDAAGGPVPGAVLTTAAGTAIAELGSTGDAWFPNGLPNRSISKGLVTLVVSNAPAGSTLLVRRIPQAAHEPKKVTSAPTNATGETVLTYEFDGPALYASRSATLVVKDSTGQQVEADVTWSIGQSSGVLRAPGGSRSDLLTRPAEAQPSASCEIRVTVARTDGVTPVGLVVDAEFQRHNGFDRILGPHKIGKAGAVSIRTSAMTIADAVVRHPMVSRIPLPGRWPKIPPLKNRTAEVIEREELIRIILELAAGEGDGASLLTDDGRGALVRLLALNEVPSAADALSAIRAKSQTLEHEEPHLALHVRHAKAIVLAAPSAFVGKVNLWFDAAMARATQQYTAKARAWTVMAAFLVAVILQFNSIELLQRLSTDQTFRSSLVDMARVEQDRIDKLQANSQSAPGTEANSPPPPSSSALDDELALLRAKREEIAQNLATLRAPELAILPDHLLWQSVPRARLVRDPLWGSPYPSRLQLVAGGQTWDVQPAWRNDYLSDLKTAIEASGAPLATAIQKGGEYLVLKADTPFEVRVFVSGRSDNEPAEGGGASDDPASTLFTEVKPERLGDVVETELRMLPDWPLEGATLGRMQLVVDSIPKVVQMGSDQAPFKVVRAELVDRLRKLLSASETALDVSVRCERARVAVSCSTSATSADVEKVLILTGRSQEIRDIRLLSNPDDPFSNRLSKPQRRPRAWRVPAAILSAAVNPTLRVFTYQRDADGPEDLTDVSRYIEVGVGAGRRTSPNSGTPEPPRAEAPLAAVERTAWVASVKKPEHRVSYKELPREQRISEAPPSTEAEKAAAGLKDLLRTPLAKDGDEATWWPATLTADVYRSDELVLTATRLGELALRRTPGKADSNVLSQPIEAVSPWSDSSFFFGRLDRVFGPGLFGILLSWALLSLGAPFWFDALKNALKLRPSAAVTEERNSRERQVQNPLPNQQPVK